MLIEPIDEMGHIIEESLSLINATMTEVKNNRDTMIMLVDSVTELKLKLTTLTQVVMDEIEMIS